MADTRIGGRLPALDLLRYLAVVAVVVDHATNRWTGTDVSASQAAWVANGLVQWAVPALLMVSGYLAGSRIRYGAAPNLAKRLYRILVPYFAWGIFYQAVLGVAAWRASEPVHLATPLDYLFGGPVYHVLWYLPMLAYCTVVGSIARTRRARLIVLSVALSVRVFSIVVFAGIPSPSYWLTVDGFIFAMPWYIALYVAAESWAAGDFGDVPRHIKAIYVAAAVAWLAVGIFYPYVIQHSTVLVRGLQRAAAGVAAAGALLLAVRAKSVVVALPRSVASSSLGVYVMHMAVLIPVWWGLTALGVHWLLGTVIATAVSVSVCTAASIGLARVPFLRPLVT